MPKYGNRARVSTATTGTGTITLGSPTTGYQSFAAAGVANGNVVRYAIEDGTAWEIGTGTYPTSGTTLSRTLSSSSTGSLLSLTGSAVVFLAQAAEDIPQLVNIQDFTTVGTTAWVKPAGAKFVHVIIYGGGGGGGSGAMRTNTTTAAAGAGGGGAGGRVELFLDEFLLGATETVIVGAGGTGGAAVTTARNGNAGVSGSQSSFGIFIARPGLQGGAGQPSSGGGGGTAAQGSVEFASNNLLYTAGGGSGTASGNGGAGNNGGTRPGAGGGGSGNAANSATARLGGNGGKGGAVMTITGIVTSGSGPVGTNNSVVNGPDALDLYYGGDGGAGGGYNANVGRSGGVGGLPGGGGGGGSHGDVGFAAGAGGNGARGAVRVTTYF
jgi:hypothetical protein